MSKTIKIFTYVLYFSLATSFFLYYLFPAETFRTYIESNFNLHNSSLNLSILRVKPAFPPGIKLENATIKNKESVLLTAETTKIIPWFPSLLGNTPRFRISSNANGGTIDSRLDIDKRKRISLLKVDTRLDGVMIKFNTALNNRLNSKFTGTLSGSMTYDITKLPADTIEAAFSVADCRIELSTPLLSLKPFIFKSIKIDFSATNARIKIRQAIFDGQETDGTVSGLITLKDPLKDSNINLSGTFVAHPDFLREINKSFPGSKISGELKAGGRIPFRLRGTFERPLFM